MHDSYWKLYRDLGVYDRNVDELASHVRQDRHGRNSSYILYSFIHKKNRTLPISISGVNIPIQVRKPKMVRQKQWPVIYASSWLKMCMEDPKYGGYFVLGGKTLDEMKDVRAMFATFWERYSNLGVAPQHPETCIPLLLHGDEGRGQLKRPLMVISYQCVISHAGPGKTNTSKKLAILI